MARVPSTPLSPLESRVMDFTWRRGRVTADDVYRELDGQMTNASVRTILRRMEAKGFLRHDVEGRAFVYEPAVDATVAARSAVRRLLDRFYGGSAAGLVAGLMDGRLIDKPTLRRLAASASGIDKKKK